MFTVLFVCTANICRTPMAHSNLERLVKEAGLSDLIRVESAGTWAVVGHPAAELTQAVCAENELDVSQHRSKPIDLASMKTADLVLVMGVEHKRDLSYIFPHYKDKIFTLKEYGHNDPPDSRSIADPIGKAFKYYRETFEIIRGEVERIFPLIRRRALDKAQPG